MADVMTKEDVWVKKEKEEVLETDDSGHATEEEDLTDELDVTHDTSDIKPEDEEPSTQDIVWGNVVKFVILHSLARTRSTHGAEITGSITSAVRPPGTRITPTGDSFSHTWAG